MSESHDQVVSVPASPKPSSASYLSSPAISTPPSQLQSPSLSRSPLFQTPQHPRTTTKPITRHEKTYSHSPQVFSAPVSQLHSPSMSRSPFLGTPDRPITMPASGARTPLGYIRSRNLTPKFLTPLASPLRKALRLTKLDPHDAWLPITESRNGNALYAAFHTLCSGIGFEALILPVAFTFLGW
ncbi:hypothetical protein Tco_1552083 [Tanacetum coccineum]